MIAVAVVVEDYLAKVLLPRVHPTLLEQQLEATAALWSY
jgi:hypothetical protein